MTNQTLITPIEYLKGVGPHRADVLRKELAIHNYQDLLQHYPFRYIDRTKFYKISELNDDLPAIQLIARIVTVETVGEKNKKRLIAQIKDDTGSMELVWFQAIKWLEKTIKPGLVFIVFGKPSTFNNKTTISHPEMELFNPSARKTGNLTLQPVYGSTEKLKLFSLDSKGIQALQAALIDSVYDQIDETLPINLINTHHLSTKREAIKNIHFPTEPTILKAALYRLKFEELFFIQLKLLRTKLLRTQKFKGLVFSKVGEAFNSFYNNSLPFDLTQAQKRVLKEIRQDTQRNSQMNRLLQGDVGSGKTVVALMSMLIAIDNGYQACIIILFAS